MKRILVYGMTSNYGGIEAYLMNLYRRLDPVLLQFDFICDFDRMVCEDEVKANGSFVEYIPAKGKDPIGHLRGWKRVLQAHPESETVYYNVLNAGAAFSMGTVRRAGRRIVVHSHNASDDNLKLHLFFKPLLLRYTDLRIACSGEAAVHMFDAPDTAEIVLNAVDTERFRFDEPRRTVLREQMSVEDDQLVLIHVGRMTKQKNPLFLVDITAEVIKRRPGTILWYIGQGEMRGAIEARANEAGIGSSIQFLGMRDDVSDLMKAADCFLLPSRYEGLPVVAVEAQASSLPVLTSVEVTREVELTDCICFLPLGDAEEWAETAIDMIENYIRHDTSAAIRHSGFDVNVESRRVQALLLQ